jgi:SHS2 domain-containing protein
MTHLPQTRASIRTFEEVEHTADRALRICGRDLSELFTHAALGMNSLILSGGGGRLSVAKQIELEAIDAESLLVAWLSELAFWAETASLIFTQFEFLSISETRLSARIRGDPVEALEKHVKAVTFHNIRIQSEEGGLTTTVVFDV